MKRLVVLVVLLGCGSKKEAPPAATGSGSGSAVAVAPSDADAGSGSGSAAVDDPPAPPFDEKPYQAVVDAWLDAQNKGDFAAYSALYADKFEGVKRVNTRMWRFDHAGWLKDRQRMFTKPMKVDAVDVEIRGNADSAGIWLTQKYTQGAFHDEGPKHLVVAKTPQGYRIAREELLQSRVGGTVATDSPYHLVFCAGGCYVKLGEDADSAWLTGRPHYDETANGTFVAFAPAAKAPAGEKVAYKYLAAAGGECTASAGEVFELAGGTPHWMTQNEWRGMDEDGHQGKPLSEAHIAREVFALSPAYLAREIVAADPKCEPVLAVDAASPATTLGRGGNTAAAGPLLDAFKALPEFAQIQTEFVTDYEGKGPWTTAVSDRTFSTAAGVKLHVLSANEGAGCGQFFGQLTVIFREDAGGKLQRISPENFGYTQVTAIVDADGKGTTFQIIGIPDDFATVAGRFDLTGDSSSPLDSVSFPFNDCGC